MAKLSTADGGPEGASWSGGEEAAGRGGKAQNGEVVAGRDLSEQHFGRVALLARDGTREV